MFDFSKLYPALKGYLRSKTVRIGILILAGLFLISLTLECWLNFKVRAYLKESLGWGSGPRVKITAHLSWLSIADAVSGRVGWVRIDGENCLISNLRFAKLHLENKGFTFSTAALFRERRLELLHLNKTVINASVAASDFSDYLNLFYPQFKPELIIHPRELILSGEAQIFGNAVPAEIAGLLKVAGTKSLRFYPTGLFISGRAVPRDFLRFAGTQVPLEFSLMQNLPLAITKINLKDGYLVMSFKEYNR